MFLSSFFQYPTLGLGESAGDLVFLEDRSEEDWQKLLAHTDVRRFRAGEEVIRAGDTDRALYIVTEGTLEVFLPRPGGAAGGSSRSRGRPLSASCRSSMAVRARRRCARSWLASCAG